MSESFDAAVVATERDALTLALADLRADYRDAVRSVDASVEATVKAQQERDAALATIGRVRAAFYPTDLSRLVLDRVRKALEPAQDAREGTSKATKGESQPCESPNPTTGLTEATP